MPAIVDCSFAHLRPSPAQIINYFSRRGVPITPRPAPPLPAGSCADATFSVAHHADWTVIAYPSYAAAASAEPRWPNAVRASIYVLALPSVTPQQRQGFITLMRSFMQVSDPLIPMTTLMTTPG